MAAIRAIEMLLLEQALDIRSLEQHVLSIRPIMIETRMSRRTVCEYLHGTGQGARYRGPPACCATSGLGKVLAVLLVATGASLVSLPTLSADAGVSPQHEATTRESAKREQIAPASTPLESTAEPTTLESLLQQVRALNPEIAAARHEVDAAQQRIGPAHALENPMVEIGILNLPVESQSLHDEDMTMKMLGLSQRVPFPGKRDLRAAVASADADSAECGYEETVNRILRDAHLAYLELNLVHQSRDIVIRNRFALQQFLSVAQARYTVGGGALPDVLKAQTQLTRMSDELLRIAREEATVQAELHRMLDSAANAAPIVPAPSSSRPGGASQGRALNADVLRQSAVANRPQLRGLQAMIERSDRQIELMQREYYPDFDVRLSYGQRESMPNGMDREDMVSLTVAIDLPIWRKSRLEPQVAEARAMRERARELYRAQIAELSALLTTQLAAAEQSRRSLELMDTGLLPQSRLAVEASLAAYRVGRVDFATLLDNQMVVYTYELERARAAIAHEQALAQIEFLVGAAPSKSMGDAP